MDILIISLEQSFHRESRNLKGIPQRERNVHSPKKTRVVWRPFWEYHGAGQFFFQRIKVVQVNTVCGFRRGSANSLADMLLGSAPQRPSTNPTLSRSWRSLIMETTRVIHTTTSHLETKYRTAYIQSDTEPLLNLHNSGVITGNI